MNEDRRRELRPIGYAGLASIIMVAGLLALAIVAEPGPVITTKDEPTTTVTLPVSPLPTIEVIVEPAVATALAVRVSPPTTIPFDPVAHVNALPYEVLNPEPVREAYIVVARMRGWDEATIQRWMQFAVDDVPMGESVGCPLVRGGASGVQGLCEIGTQGRREDAGIGQLIGLWYNYPNGILCRSEGICGIDAILGSPYQSFNAYLAAIEFDGRGPWSYNADAKRLHWSWYTVPRYWP